MTILQTQQAIVGLFVFIGVVYLAFKQVFPRFRFPRRVTHLNNHPIFYEIDRKITFCVPRIQTSNPQKTKDVQRAMKVRLLSIKKELQSVCTSARFRTTDLPLAAMQEQYLKYLHRSDCELCACGIPKLLSDKLINWGINRREIVAEQIIMIWNSPIHENDKERIWSLFNILMMAVELIMVDMINGANSINGELESYYATHK